MSTCQSVLRPERTFIGFRLTVDSEWKGSAEQWEEVVTRYVVGGCRPEPFVTFGDGWCELWWVVSRLMPEDVATARTGLRAKAEPVSFRTFSLTELDGPPGKDALEALVECPADRLFKELELDRFDRYRARNPEGARETRKRWKANNPDKVKAAKKRYREQHPDKVAAANKRYHKKHPDAARERARRYRERQTHTR